MRGKIGEGTFGVVFVATRAGRPAERLAIKVFKPTKPGEGVSTTAIREIALLRELQHENVVRVDGAYVCRRERSLSLAFDYAEHDLQQIIRYHVEKLSSSPIPAYTVKSFMWQILRGLRYMHSNWVLHRDMKPSNILVMGAGEEAGRVKIADFGLARIFQEPLRPLSENGVVVTIWYRAPELLLGAQHYTHAIDIWAAGCIFAELATLRPLFQGEEVKSPPGALQYDQIKQIYSILGPATEKNFPLLPSCPKWAKNEGRVRELFPLHRKGLAAASGLGGDPKAFDLLQKMLLYDPNRRISAEEALKHPYFQAEPLPGRNSFSERSGMSGKSPYPPRAYRKSELKAGPGLGRAPGGGGPPPPRRRAARPRREGAPAGRPGPGNQHLCAAAPPPPPRRETGAPIIQLKLRISAQAPLRSCAGVA